MEEEKKRFDTKFVVVVVCLVFCIVLIGMMFVCITKMYSGRQEEATRNYELQAKINSLKKELIDLQKHVSNTSEEATSSEGSSYLVNFHKDVYNELGKNNEILVTLSDIDYEESTGYLSINDSHEAKLSLFKKDSTSPETQKLADDVINAWYCKQGQAPGNNYILFLKKDGTVTYVRFRTENQITRLDTEEKTINGIKNISNIISISGNDSKGIGGNGVLIIKNDGTCYKYSSLDDLVK